MTLWHTLLEVAQELITAEVRVGPQGRVVIPALLRRAAGISTGDSLTARLEDGRIVLERRETIIARLRERFGVVPPGISLADELIADRRRESTEEVRRR